MLQPLSASQPATRRRGVVGRSCLPEVVPAPAVATRLGSLTRLQFSPDVSVCSSCPVLLVVVRAWAVCCCCWCCWVWL